MRAQGLVWRRWGAMTIGAALALTVAGCEDDVNVTTGGPDGRPMTANERYDGKRDEALPSGYADELRERARLQTN